MLAVNAATFSKNAAKSDRAALAGTGRVRRRTFCLWPEARLVVGAAVLRKKVRPHLYLGRRTATTVSQSFEPGGATIINLLPWNRD